MAANSPHQGHLGVPKGIVLHNVKVIDGVVHKIHKTIVHMFNLSDVEDPDLYAAQPILEWMDTDKGKWVMEKSIEVPVWHRYLDHMTYGYKYAIEAYLKDVDYTFYVLKWGQNS